MSFFHNILGNERGKKRKTGPTAVQMDDLRILLRKAYLEVKGPIDAHQLPTREQILNLLELVQTQIEVPEVSFVTLRQSPALTDSLSSHTVFRA